MAVKGAKGKTGRVVVWIILLLLIVGLAGFGATNFGGGVRQIGSVGDVQITVDDYARAMQEELRRLSEQLGQTITMAEAQSLGLDRAVLARLVNTAALDHEAQQIGLSVGDAQVRQEILEIPAFQGVDGSFDREGYEFVLERSGLNPAQFEERIRADQARALLQNAVTGGVRAPDVYVDTLYDYLLERRDITWATLDATDLDEEELELPSEERLRAYYEENPGPFTAPETRMIAYAWVTPDMLAPEIETDDAELRALYDERIEEYRQPERRLVERLVFPDEAAAQAAADAIAAGETSFDALVEERDLTLDDVDLGDMSRDDLGQAADAVFARDAPGVVGPAPSNLGPALYRVNAILSASEVPFEDAREDLQAELQTDRARRMIDDTAAEIEDLLASGATLEEIAGETYLEFGEMAFEPGSSEGPAAYENFRTEALAVVEGDFPELRRMEDGGIFALRLDEVRPPTLRPFEEVRDEVEAAWRADRTRGLLFERAEFAAERIASGGSFEDESLEPGVATGVERNGVVEGLPPDAVSAIFDLQPGEARALATSDGAVVVRLDAIEAADGDSEEARQVKAAFAGRASQELATDILEAFVRATEREAGISLDQSAINAVNTQFP